MNTKNDKLFFDIFGPNPLKNLFPVLNCSLCKGTGKRVALDLGEYEESYIEYSCSCLKEIKKMRIGRPSSEDIRLKRRDVPEEQIEQEMEDESKRSR
jgi:hypothetical protein